MVGFVQKPHGIKGEVKIHVVSEDPRRLEDFEEVRIKGRRCDGTYKISSVKYFKNTAIVKFEGIDDMDSAALLAGADILIDREDALPLGENEYYTGDLIGMDVYLEDGTRFGVVKSVMETGANDVYEVDVDGAEVLLPAIKECIKEINLQENKMTVHLMKGLI